MNKYIPNFLKAAFDKVSDISKDAYTKTLDTVRAACDFGVHHIQCISAALGSHSPLDHKGLHKAKIIGLPLLFLVSAATLNIEGVIGSGFASADEITKLDDIGEAVLKTHPAPQV